MHLTPGTPLTATITRRLSAVASLAGPSDVTDSDRETPRDVKGGVRCAAYRRAHVALAVSIEWLHESRILAPRIG